jgi:hypothetical protein
MTQRVCAEGGSFARHGGRVPSRGITCGTGVLREGARVLEYVPVKADFAEAR